MPAAQTPPQSSSTDPQSETTGQTKQSVSARATRVAATAVRDYFVPQATHTPQDPEPAQSEPHPDPAVERAQLERTIRVDQLVKARRMPYAATAAVGVLGTAGWGAALAIADSGGNPLIAMPVAGAATLAATGGVHFKTRKVISAEWRRRLWVAGTISAIWVAVAATAHSPGMTFVLLGTLLVLEALVSRGWRQHHPLPIGATAEDVAEQVATTSPDDEPAEPDCDVDNADVNDLVTAWSTNVAPSGGAVPGSALTGGEATEHAVAFTLQLVRGRQNINKVKAVADDIATGLGVDPEDLMIERYPRKPGEKKDSSKLRFTVVLKSPVDEPRFFEGPKLTMSSDGLSCSAAVGRYGDGVGDAQWKFWNSGGMRNGVIIGGTRSGKGGVTGVLGASQRATGMLNSIYIDPQEGMSSPGLAQNATVSILGKPAALQAIQVVEALAQNREKVSGVKKARRRKDMFDGAVPKLMPSTAQPGWVVYIDECDKIFSDQKQAKAWSEFVSRCLKLGMEVIAITQYPGLTAFSLESLRSNLAQNFIALKTYSTTSGKLIPGLTKDPSTLPDEKPGFGLFGGGERTDVPFRGDWLPEDEDKLSEEPPLRLGAALEQHAEPPVSDMDRQVLVGLLGQPDEDEVWTLSGDTVLDEQAVDLSPPAGAASSGPDFSNVASLPNVPAPLTVAPMPQISESQAAVLALVGDRPIRTGDIVSRSGLSRRQVHRLLSDLTGYGFIHQPAGTNGWWLAGTGQADEDSTAPQEVTG